MNTSFAFGSLLLLSSALIAPAAVAQQVADAQNDNLAAQTIAAPEAGGETAASDAVPGEAEDQQEIVVTGNIPNVLRATPEVVSVLSAEEIARTGEGDIAGALQRVTGLSVVGNGFVFVRGLGDRYSLALLNGSPLPSPEPLRRVVPLDIFPTSVIAGSVVQKSYSANYPGEFGGGVIDLTTRAVPEKPFLSLGVSGTFDTETTAKLGYTYFGSDTDWLGYDSGARQFPTALRRAVTSGAYGGTTTADRQGFAASLTNAETTLLQRNHDIPGNVSADLSAGTVFDVGGSRLGVIAAAGYSNNWRTRDARQQASRDPQIAAPTRDFKSVITDNRVVVNGLLGLGAEIGEHRLRWTNLYIHDTLKQGRLAAGYDDNRSADPVADPDFYGTPPLIEQSTRWFERQLIDTQFVGELKFNDLSVDLRAAYANTRRDSPYEREFGYRYLGDGNPATKSETDVDDYVNLLSGGTYANIAFSELEEDLVSGGIDLGYKLRTAIPLRLSAGYAYSDTDRSSFRYQFDYTRPAGSLPVAVAQERPDYLVSDYNLYTYGIELRDVSGAEGAPAYDAGLRIHAGYAQAEVDITPDLRASIGVRYEDAHQTVQPISATVLPSTQIDRAYWLPAATVTWIFNPDMQLRLHASKTIARPQFRELAPQVYQDFESDREFSGNPLLKDSQLLNAEARYEWYLRRSQRVTLAGFYKKIDNPIEASAFFAGGGQLRTGFANAPQAELYGAEIEAEAHLPLENLTGMTFGGYQLLLVGNYTYTHSSISADDSLIVGPNLQQVRADELFVDGAPLVGQSDHIANLQIGIEHPDRVSQATLLLTYASERVTNRGPIVGVERLPDIVEKPGLRVDFVAREELPLFGANTEVKFEVRNILGRKYEEYQQFGGNRIDINTYDVGTTLSLGVGAKF